MIYQVIANSESFKIANSRSPRNVRLQVVAVELNHRVLIERLSVNAVSTDFRMDPIKISHFELIARVRTKMKRCIIGDYSNSFS